MFVPKNFGLCRFKKANCNYWPSNSNQFGHDIDGLNHATVVDEAHDYYNKRLFLKAWYSQRDQNGGNKHINIPNVYKSCDLLCRARFACHIPLNAILAF